MSRAIADSIKARFENGVLEVVLPGAKIQLEPKRITIDGVVLPEE